MTAGRLLVVKRYRRADLAAHRDKLFAFGDNMAGTGRSGQAAEARDEPNAVGIPTKWRPGAKAEDYYGYAALAIVRPAIQERFRELAAHLAKGGDVVWPEDGVGTGRAQLERYAPNIARYLDRCFEHLCWFAA